MSDGEAAVRSFINELGNRITISVSTGQPDPDAVCTTCRYRGAHAPSCPKRRSGWPVVPFADGGVLVRIEGPSSVSGNYLTQMEAWELGSALMEALDRKPFGGIVNQSESGGATAEDIAWLEGVLKTGEHPRHRRILNSLRSPAVPVADRERLARALYIIGDEPCLEATRAANWDQATGGFREDLRAEWLGEADRLQRILGGFPAVTESCPYAWEIDNMRRDSGRGRSLVYHPDEADFYRRERPTYSVTPLYAAPVVQQEPRAWECPKCGAIYKWVARDPSRPVSRPACIGGFLGTGHAPVSQDDGTPLYALETTNGK